MISLMEFSLQFVTEDRGKDALLALLPSPCVGWVSTSRVASLHGVAEVSTSAPDQPQRPESGEGGPRVAGKNIG